MSIYNISYHSIEGTNANDTIVADHAAADALYSFDTQAFPGQINGSIWNRWVEGHGGNDAILRDRPGDYKPAGVSEFLAYTTGNVVVDGGTGTDTVSYQSYGGGIEADLQHDGVGGWTQDGWVKSYGATPEAIHGRDLLKSVENLRGTEFADKIVGSEAANELHGLGGNDQIWGMGGNDKIYGGNGNDVLNGGAGNDQIWGGAGHDDIVASDGNDIVHGGDGSDDISGGTGADWLFGGNGDDHMEGGNGSDQMFGDGGYNTLFGQSGDDTIHVGTRGFADGGSGDDVITGGNLADTLKGGANDDVLNGQAGNDVLAGGTGNDELNGGSGQDTASYEAAVGNVQVFQTTWGGGFSAGSHGSDQLDSIENFIMGQGDDLVMGSNLSNAIQGRDGDDMLYGNDGNDALYGDDGDDLLVGGSGADSLLGGNGDDDIHGGSGNDLVTGGAGNDSIRGGDGLDQLHGGGGTDLFVFKGGDTGIDRIKDFQLGTDAIVLDDYLASPPGIGESYVGDVFAYSIDGGFSTMLAGVTDAGLVGFAILEGHNANVINGAISNGSLFTGATVTPEGPGGLSESDLEGSFFFEEMMF